MIIPGFEAWRESAKALFLEEHEKDKCTDCDGTGSVDCWECGHESECDFCDDGVVYVNKESDDTKKMPAFTPQDYYKDMMGELAKLAAWQGKPPIVVMLPVARSVRKTLPNAVRLRKYRRSGRAA